MLIRDIQYWTWLLKFKQVQKENELAAMAKVYKQNLHNSQVGKQNEVYIKLSNLVEGEAVARVANDHCQTQHHISTGKQWQPSIRPAAILIKEGKYREATNWADETDIGLEGER